MNIMKTGLFVAALLVLSVFAGSMGLAREAETNDDSRLGVSSISSSLETTGIDVEFESEIELEDEADGSLSSDIYRGFPASVHFGTGWAIQNDKGYLAAISWVSKTFVKKSDTTSQTEVARGTLQVGDTRFKLRGDDSTTFSVYGKQDGEDGQIGTLTLSNKRVVGTLTLWEGDLSLDSGVTYKLTLATQERAVKQSSDDDDSDDDSKKVRARGVTVECYDGTTETFRMGSDVAVADLQEKARAFCANRCEGEKCGINSFSLVDVKTSNSGSSTSAEIKTSESTSKVDANTEVKSEKAFERFWKRVFSRSGSNSGSN